MKFYLVWDKEREQYVGAYRRFEKEYSQTPRIYFSHMNAAAAASGWVRDNNALIDTEEVKRLRKERYAIHEYESTTFKEVS